MNDQKKSPLWVGLLAWTCAIILFFPIFWVAVTAFKTEHQAYMPSLIFMPTLDTFREVFERSNYLAFVKNSMIVSLDRKSVV